MQRGVVGAANLNQVLQEALNPASPPDKFGNSTPELRRGGYTFRPGDKVMQIRNDYDKEVFNGDIGAITSVDLEERSLSVVFDDRIVDYDISELDELVLAYATTVHKAQGAEYPIVVMPIMMTHFVMLQRNLLYTGVTRAKKGLVLVGQKKAVGYCVRNVTVDKRNTLLAERLAGKALSSRVPAGRYICFDVETPNYRNDTLLRTLVPLIIRKSTKRLIKKSLANTLLATVLPRLAIPRVLNFPPPVASVPRSSTWLVSCSSWVLPRSSSPAARPNRTNLITNHG